MCLWQRARHPALALILNATFLGFGSVPASAVECGDVITEDTVLDRDLRCIGDGLVVGAQGVVIDLGGHEIVYVDDGETYDPDDYAGIRDPGYRVQISNGAIRGFGQGIVVEEGAHGTSLRNLDVQAEYFGVTIKGCDHVRLNALTIWASSIGVRIVSSNGAVIVGVEAGGESAGLSLLRSNNARIRSGDFDTAHGNGVSLQSSSGTWILGNRIEGVELSSSNDNRIWRNRVRGDEDTQAVIVTDSHGNSIARNDVQLGGGALGIDLIRSDRTRVVRNVIRHLGERQALGVFSGVANLIAWNRVMGSFADCSDFVREPSTGIYIDPGARETIVSHNFLTGTDNDGIAVWDTTATLSANRADSNCDLGIDAPRGAIDGGRNTASGNGNPAQCVNVDCGP